MKNKRIIKILQWCIGGMLILLIGVGSILSPLGTHTVHAASIQISDAAGILDGDQVRSTASQLSHPVSISTVRTFEGPKSDFVRNTEQALTGQDAIAIGISVEQRYLAIVAGKQVGLSAEQIVQAREAFAQAYGGNAGANGNYTAATLAALESLQASLGNGGADGIANPLQLVGRVLSNPLTWILLILALTGISLFVLRRLSGPRNAMIPVMGMPWRQRPGPRDEYGRSIDPDSGYVSQRFGSPPSYGSGYDSNGYVGRPMYSPGYPPQGGMNPWMAGGLGALGGGFLVKHGAVDDVAHAILLLKVMRRERAAERFQADCRHTCAIRCWRADAAVSRRRRRTANVGNRRRTGTSCPNRSCR